MPWANAASNIGFQESVYLGKRSHKTVKAQKSVAAICIVREGKTVATPAAKAGSGQSQTCTCHCCSGRYHQERWCCRAQTTRSREIEPPAELTVDDFHYSDRATQGSETGRSTVETSSSGTLNR